MMRSFLNLYRMEVGFDTSRLLTMTFILPTRKYTDRSYANGHVMRRMEERLNTVGAVVGPDASSLPLFGGAARQLAIDGKPRSPATSRRPSRC